MTIRETRTAVADVLAYEIEHARQNAGHDDGQAEAWLSVAAIRMADAIATRKPARAEFYARCGLTVRDVARYADRNEQIA